MPVTKDEFLPNDAGYGKIGNEAYPWGEGHFSELRVGGQAITPGDDGEDGEDGPSVEFQSSATHIQSRLVGAEEWNDVIPLADIAGQVFQIVLGEFQAAVPISGGRFVRLGADGLLYPGDGPAGYAAGGFIRQSVEAEANITVYLSGLLPHLGNMTPGAIQFLGENGTRTEMPPSVPGAVVQQLGRALSESAMAVNLQLAIQTN